MQQLQIDFSGRRGGSPWLGRVLLALAACVALDAAWSYHSARSTLSENQARVAKRTPGGAAPKATPQEVAAVRETVQRLSLPWDELFSALESAASDKVALAAIEPDCESRHGDDHRRRQGLPRRAELRAQPLPHRGAGARAARAS